MTSNVMQSSTDVTQPCPTTDHEVDREEKKSLWTAEQLCLAQRAAVPHSELYGCGEGPSPSLGSADPSFVHTRFLLPDLEAALLGSSNESRETKSATSVAAAPIDSMQLSPYWQSLLRQLRWDRTQQRSYCEGKPKVNGHLQQGVQTAHDASSSGKFTTPTTSDSTCVPPLTHVGGVDISFIPGSNDGIACLAILRYPSLEPVKTYMHRCTLREPYISTFLAFREIQPVRELFKKVWAELEETQTVPQLLLVDGNGVHHPRRCGLATHLGVTLNIPTIGCSKKILQVDGITREVVEEAFLKQAGAAAEAHQLPAVLPLVGTRGSGTAAAPLYGYAVHGHKNSVKKCIFVSPGHCVGFAVATALVLTMLRHRIPEPIRAADLGSRAYIRDTVTAAVVPATAGAAEA